MRADRLNPRQEHQLREARREDAAPTLAQKYPQVKSVDLGLANFGADGAACHSRFKYSLNPAGAKSVIRFACHNSECVDGDFDLGGVLEEAVRTRQTDVSGELQCQGWKSRTVIGASRCGSLLQYALRVEYYPQTLG